MSGRKVKNGSRTTTYTKWILRNRWLVVLATLAVVVLGSYGAKNLYFNQGYRIWFAPDNAQLASFEQIERTYTKNDNVLIALAPEDKEVFSERTLQAVRELTEASWKMPYAIRVDAISNFQHTIAEEDDLLVRDLVHEDLEYSQAEMSELERVALAEPVLYNRLITDGSQVTGINVTLQYPDDNPDAVSEVAAYTDELRLMMAERYPEISVYMTGIAMINNAFSEAGKSDMANLTPLMYLAMIAMLFFSLRSVSGTFSTLLVITFSMVFAMGVAGWFGVGLTPMSLTAPTIIMTLAIADCVHIIVSVLRQMRAGKTKNEAIVESVRLNIIPVFLTSLTTAIGFLSLNWIPVPPINHLGNITAVGVFAAFAFSVFTLPALLSLLPLRARRKKEQAHPFFGRIAETVIASRKVALWGSAAVVVALVSLIPLNELNDRFTEYFDETILFRTDTDYITETLTSPYQAEFSLSAGESQGITSVDYLNTVEEFANWYREHPKVTHVSTFTDVMKRLNMNMHGDDSAFYRLPDNPELAAQYLLLYEMSLPYGLDLNNQINVDKSATRFVVTMQGSVSTKEIRSITGDGERWLQNNTPKYMHASGSSPSVMFAHISDIALNNMLLGTTLALILVSGVILIALRSVKLGLLSLAPNLVPIGVGFGVWALYSGEINMGMAPVIGMTLGIVVDDTIHFLTKYVRARREENLGAADSVRYAFTTVGPAMTITTVTLVVGFSILSLSAFSLNADMALLTAITIAVALIADFIFLPALLLQADGAPAMNFERSRSGRTADGEVAVAQVEN